MTQNYKFEELVDLDDSRTQHLLRDIAELETNQKPGMFRSGWTAFWFCMCLIAGTLVFLEIVLPAWTFGVFEKLANFF